MHNTDGRRFYNTLQKWGCWFEKRNFSISCHLKNFQSCILEMGKLTLNSATSFLTKSDRISSETSCFLKFEIWIVSLSINCNFSRHLDQVSHRNNQPLPFFNFLIWYGVWYPSLNIRLWISMNISLAEEVEFWHH